ncbi:MAG: hypothetical protein ACLP1X_12575 [Polyangiaceae bacterium]|jgi:hypothetical protein
MNEPRPGWNRPRPAAIPPPSVWPAALALGTALLAWGVVASPIILVFGLVLFGVSLGGWIGEIRHER